jgi:hypothetical protein
VLAGIALPVLACEVPDEGDMPWRRAVAKVKYRAETEAWAGQMARDRILVKYVVLIDAPKRLGGRCYWPVEVRAEDRLWKRFLVTPDGQKVIEDVPQ